jgi:Tol biopolymer transport system component/DNA-binding winged helix-turn-helix (wHTH) protein
MSFESLKDDLKNPEDAGNGLQPSSSRFYEFGDFRLDAAKRLLLHQGVVVPLTPKAFDVLLLLVSRQGQVVGKDEILSRVWPDTIVEENNLNVNVSLLRKTLGEKPNDHQFIVTVPGSGYQFVAEVRYVGDENSGAAARRAEASNGSVSRPRHIAIVDEAATRTVKGMARPTSSAQSLVIMRNKRGAVVALAALIVVVAGVSLGWYKFASRSRTSVKPVAPLQTMKIARLTSNGKANQAAISPDGRWVVHVMDDAGQQSLWMRQAAKASDVQIVAPADVVYKGLTFSRDGNYVYYVKWDKKTFTALYQMPVLGGVARRLVVDIDSTVTFSPDDRQFAFLRGDPEIGESALIVANSDGSSERKVAVRKEPDFFPTWFDTRNAPAWSLDGKVIAYPAGRNDASGRHMTVVVANVADGAVKPITSQRWWQIESVEWLRDGSGLVLNAREQSSSPFQIWYLSYPGGGVRRITNDLNDYRGMSLTADSTALATVQSDQVSNISIARTGDTKDATQLTSGKFDGVDGISWTPDGKIVYASRASGSSDIWVMNQDGKNQKQLTADAGNNSRPAVSADGRYIVFTSDRTGTDHIWRMNIDGSNSKQLTSGNREGWPDCSPDGQWVVYNSVWPSNFLWKVPIAGGEPVQVIDRFSGSPAISPDGRLLASFYWDVEAGKVAIYPFAGGQPIRSFEIWTWVRWTPDGRGLAYIDRRNLLNLTSQPIDGSPSKHLTDFKDGRIFNFAWSRDGKQLALARGTVTNDVVLISNFKDQQ